MGIDLGGGLSGAVGVVMSFIVTISVMPFLMMLVALPLSAPLADAVDHQQGGVEVERGALEGIMEGVKFTVKLVTLGLIVSLVLTIFSLIPVIGLLAAGFNLLIWVPLVICLDVTDFTFTRRAWTLRSRIISLLKTPLKTMSVGLICLPLLSIPLLNLVGALLAAVIGTLFAREVEATTSKRFS
jgi:CysZ protein